ncbi:MAG TPA: diacylglycerol kinase family protein [Chloroflexota bacterium]|nr:diacylglycerol kinase family protein [Chloroflexota bacterium]
MRALLIHNTRSGQRDRDGEVAAAVQRLVSAGWKLDVVSSASAAELESQARRAVDAGVDMVIAAGGDGTLNLAIQALAYRRAVLGVLPTGTTNVWAQELGIPTDIPAATQLLLSGCTARVDLGRADGRYFLFVAGIGFDASVTREISPAAKRKLGKLAYVVAAIVQAAKLRGTEATIVADGKVSRQRVLMVVASNTRLYGGVLNMAPEAFVDDGLLDFWVFRGRGLMAAAVHALTILVGRHYQDPGARYYRSASLTVISRGSLPVQLDGDYYGVTPVTISVAPEALRVVVPPGHHAILSRQLESWNPTTTESSRRPRRY